jgi:hypothetical protein
MRGCVYSAGRICCGVAGVLGLAFAVRYFRQGDEAGGVLCGLFALAPLLLLAVLVPQVRKPGGPPRSLSGTPGRRDNLGVRVRETEGGPPGKMLL